jgi:hypothetical protein
VYAEWPWYVCAYLGPSYADLSFSSSYERQLDKRHGQILIHDASFRFMFLYVMTHLSDLARLAGGAETCRSRLADRHSIAAGLRGGHRHSIAVGLRGGQAG